MATQSRNLSIYRPEFIVHKLRITYAEPNATTYKLPMGMGTYMLAVIVRTVTQFNGSSGSVKVGLMAPFLDEAQSVVGDATWKLGITTSTNTDSVTEVEIARSANVATYLLPTAFNNMVLPLDNGPWNLNYGVRLTWTNTLGGTPTAGEVEVLVLAGRMV